MHLHPKTKLQNSLDFCGSWRNEDRELLQTTYITRVIDLLLDRYELLHSGRDPEAGTHIPDTSQTVTGLPDMT